jgi:DDE superfamily endonuclease
VQIAVDAETRLVIATGDPQPGNRNDCTVYRDSGIKDELGDRPVMTDGGYRGNPEVIMPYRTPIDGELTVWQEDLNSIHRTVRARVEHALAPHEVLEDPPGLPTSSKHPGRHRFRNRPPSQPHAHRLTEHRGNPTRRSIT